MFGESTQIVTSSVSQRAGMAWGLKSAVQAVLFLDESKQTQPRAQGVLISPSLASRLLGYGLSGEFPLTL